MPFGGNCNPHLNKTEIKNVKEKGYECEGTF